MKFLSRLAEKPLVNYESTKAMDSKAVPGVRFAIQPDVLRTADGTVPADPGDSA